jgi:hypothetical protein
VIRVLSDATVVASAVTAASAAAPESVTVAVAVTATRPAAGRLAPPVALRVTVPPLAGAYTVNNFEPALAPEVELLVAEVVAVSIVISTGVPEAVKNAVGEVIPPEANRAV